jgi:lysophospholipase L1-like esterase
MKTLTHNRDFNMIKLILSVLCFASISLAAPPVVSPASRESIEWCDIWIAQADQAGLPRVLLIGDSITRAYDPAVEQRLAGKAYVARLATSAFLSDPMLLKQVEMLLDSMKFDVIHFNNGMHGWQHSEAEYRQAFPEFLATIQKHAPHAKLIWATTTPLRVSTPINPGEAQPSDERIAARNAIAREFVAAQNIAIDDLNALMAGHPEYHSDNIHFNEQGIALQADQVAAAIEKVLKH